MKFRMALWLIVALITHAYAIDDLHVWPLGQDTCGYDVAAAADALCPPLAQCRFAPGDPHPLLPYPSLRLDGGATSFLELPVTRPVPQRLDFVLAVYVKPSSLGGVVLDFRGEACGSCVDRLTLTLTSTGKLNIYACANEQCTDTTTTGNSSFEVNTWQHLMFGVPERADLGEAVIAMGSGRAFSHSLSLSAYTPRLGVPGTLRVGSGFHGNNAFIGDVTCAYISSGANTRKEPDSLTPCISFSLPPEPLTLDPPEEQCGVLAPAATNIQTSHTFSDAAKHLTTTFILPSDVIESCMSAPGISWHQMSSARLEASSVETSCKGCTQSLMLQTPSAFLNPSIYVTPPIQIATADASSPAQAITADVTSSSQMITVDVTPPAQVITADVTSSAQIITPDVTPPAQVITADVTSSSQMITVDVTPPAQVITADVTSSAQIITPDVPLADGETTTADVINSVMNSSTLGAPPDASTSAADTKSRCLCGCKCPAKVSSVSGDTGPRSVIKTFAVNKTTLTVYRRKLTSAPDFRPSAIAVGSVGSAVLVCVCLTFVLWDVCRLLRMKQSPTEKEKKT